MSKGPAPAELFMPIQLRLGVSPAFALITDQRVQRRALRSDSRWLTSKEAKASTHPKSASPDKR
ncbi:hypothetical protein A5791_18600 [Mycobacterium sp. 852002-51163_SCH5372311]|uniref:hypothetical protein n=1 Tax=Mycobacterium sp. 852002-51163_SCH5372311 TaxID=1834097 RepID=UPI0007FD5204|nr:hypothetical protein [Mycobacterium sp. 852002-51163_SCH5372311]OBF87934.1 hypothetical protein A5791_18600 [Mycobacterium sp. 852002-51163_SCH5372311]